LSVVLDADDGIVKRRDAARKKESRKDRKDKGYVMFEEEDSEEELVAEDAIKYVDTHAHDRHLVLMAIFQLNMS